MTLETSSFIKAIASMALGLSLAASASAATVISWDVDNYGTVSGSAHFAGVVSVANWTSTVPPANGTGLLLNLIDNTGAATTLDLSFSAKSRYQIQTSHPGVDLDGTYNRELLNGYINAGSSVSPATSSVALSQIHFSTYNIIVYFSSDTANRTGTVTDGTTTYDFSTIGLTSVSGTSAVLAQTTSTGGTNPLANYAIFSGLTGTSRTITVNIPSFGGIAGLQVVDATAIPEPAATAALLGGFGILTTLAVRRRRT